MKLLSRSLFLCTVSLVVLQSTPAEAQTARAVERRVERNARQLQRQANLGAYYTPQTWQQIDPWARSNGISPLARAANAVGNATTAVGNAIGQTVDAATPIGDGQFGYQDQSPQNSWFYDYYSYSPTYYTTGTEDRYAGAVRYFDSDGDGVYDSRSTYRDSDDDGRYDEYDRLDFYSQAGTDATLEPNVQNGTAKRIDISANAQADTNDDADLYRGPQDARRHTVQGEIASTKLAQVNGSENLVVGLKQNNDTLAVDLGPAADLQGKNVEIGASIVAVGAMEKIGDKDLLMADSVRIGNGQSIAIERNSSQRFTGEIIEVKNTMVGSNDHYMAIVDIDGERQLADLGPVSTYKVKLQPSTKIIIQGVPVRAQDHRVIMAEQVRLGNEVIRIQRTQSL